MVVTSKGIVNGVIEDKYGKHGSHFNENGMPTYSLPLKIEDAPEGTKSFAVVLEDKDAFLHEHRSMYEAILDHNVELAREMASNHIDRIYKTLHRGIAAQ